MEPLKWQCAVSIGGNFLGLPMVPLGLPMVQLVPTFPPMVTFAPMVPLAAEKRTGFYGYQLVKFSMLPLGESRMQAEIELWAGNGSFRARVVSVLGLFGLGRFCLSSFGTGSFRPICVGRLGLIFFPTIGWFLKVK